MIDKIDRSQGDVLLLSWRIYHGKCLKRKLKTFQIFNANAAQNIGNVTEKILATNVLSWSAGYPWHFSYLISSLSLRGTRSNSHIENGACDTCVVRV